MSGTDTLNNLSLAERLCIVNGWDDDELAIIDGNTPVMETYTPEGQVATRSYGTLEALVNLAITYIGVEEFTKWEEWNDTEPEDDDDDDPMTEEYGFSVGDTKAVDTYL